MLSLFRATAPAASSSSAAAARPTAEGERTDALSPSHVLATAKSSIERAFGRVVVAGELAEVRPASSGHVYFKLKDQDAALDAALFAGNRSKVRFALDEGLEVYAEGRVSVFRGRVQLVVDSMEPKGAGLLALRFEQLKTKLQQEGLLDAARKVPLPLLPRAVGIVTSLQTAALRDVLKVIGARFPTMHVVLSTCAVQGANAPAEIATAITRLDRATRADGTPLVDVMLVVRGGGSQEDLAAFNEEVVARAIAAARVPVVAGVGHETDISIADLVADVRAATPSQAAELAVPRLDDLHGQVERWARRMVADGQKRADRARLRVERLEKRLVDPRMAMVKKRARIDALHERLRTAAQSRLRDAHERTDAAIIRLEALSPLAVLVRGYAIATTTDGAVVRAVDDVAVGDALAVRVADGVVGATVTSKKRA